MLSEGRDEMDCYINGSMIINRSMLEYMKCNFNGSERRKIQFEMKATQCPSMIHYEIGDHGKTK